MVENMLLENIQAHRNVNIELGKVPVEIKIDESKINDHDAYPFELVLRPADEANIPLSQQDRGTNGLRDQKSKNHLKLMAAKHSANGHLKGHVNGFIETSTSHYTNGDSRKPTNGVSGETQDLTNGRTIHHTYNPISTDGERIRAKYIIASDGAHSWTRRHLQIPFPGENSESLWGEPTGCPRTKWGDTELLQA